MLGETLLLVNPKKRRRSRKGKMPAGLARYWASKRRHANPSRRRRKHTSRHSRHRSVVRMSNPARAFRRYRRRNPISLRNPLGVLKPALIGGAGALAVNGLTNYLVAPNAPSLVAGRMVYATKFGLALLLGTLGRKILGAHAEKMAEGALTVLAATAMNDVLLNTAGVNLSGIAYYSPAASVSSPGNAPRLSGVKTVLSPGPITEVRSGPLSSPRLGRAGEYVSFR